MRFPGTTATFGIVFALLSCLGEVNSFSTPQSLNLIRLRTTPRLRPRTETVCVMLPDGSKKVDGDEVKDSLKRFVDTAPQGIWHMMEKKVVPAAKAVILKELNKNKAVVEEEETGAELAVNADDAVNETENEIEAESEDTKTVLEAPDSSDTMAKLQALLDRSVAEELEDFEYTGLQNSGGSPKGAAPSWMLDAKDLEK